MWKSAWIAAIITLTACGNNSSVGGGPGPGDDTPIGPNGELRGEANFAAIMKNLSRGQASVTPWAGSWWPYLSGGTSDADLKYESAHGASGAVSWELSHHGPSIPGVQDWWGHCNGWAAAATLYPEPRAPLNVGGVKFTIGDQKALLSEVAMEVNADFFGQRNDSNDPNDPTFQDVFPDQFFLVASNILGKGHQLIIDRYTGSQVWNQPLAGFITSAVTPDDYLGADPSAPGVYRVMVTTQIWWASDAVDTEFVTEPFNYADSDSFESRTFRYEVWLDAPLTFDRSGNIADSGNVILARQGETVTGGAWRNANLSLLNSYPDYMWIAHSISASTGFSNPDIDSAWVAGRFGH